MASSEENSMDKKCPLKKRDRRIYQLQRYYKNRDKELIRRAKYRNENREKLNADAREKYAASPERRKKAYAASEKWRNNNIEHVRKNHKENEEKRRLRNNPGFVKRIKIDDPIIRKQIDKEKSREYSARKRRERKIEMVSAYGGCCACCGETEIEFLTLDHVFQDGANHRRQVIKNSKLTLAAAQDRIVAELQINHWPKDGRFQILCWNCQWGTLRSSGCPHKFLGVTCAI